jgi:DNA-binding MarR family transcriptional regulator
MAQMSRSAGVRTKRAARRAEENAAAEDAVPAIDLGPLPNLMGYVLRRAQLGVFQDFWRQFSVLDIRPAQYAVLIIIERNPGLRQSQISGALGIKRANLVTLLDTLESRGLAERVPVESDRRSYALHLTDEGVAMMRKLKIVSDEHERRVAAKIGEDGKRELLRLLHAVSDTMGPGLGDEEDS